TQQFLILFFFLLPAQVSHLGPQCRRVPSAPPSKPPQPQCHLPIPKSSSLKKKKIPQITDNAGQPPTESSSERIPNLTISLPPANRESVRTQAFDTNGWVSTAGDVAMGVGAAAREEGRQQDVSVRPYGMNRLHRRQLLN
ncbi:hypothetical protein BRADI_3g14317v3, partial [Brachypodium distachyon]